VLIQRAAHTAYPERSASHRWRRLKLYVRSLVWWRATTIWLAHCFARPTVGLVRHCPAVLERMHRPFLHGHFGVRERLAASLAHHALVQRRAPHLTRRIATEGCAPIARFSIGAQHWRVSLESLSQFQKEGDWTLCIRDECGRRVVSCTFSVGYAGIRGRRARLCIGAVQGPDPSVNGRELFRALTRQWHGLRPKVLVVDLARYVAAALHADTTLLVSNRAHVYTNWRYMLRKRRVCADYDALSRDCGAVSQWNGWFVLPALPDALHDGGNASAAVVSTRKRDVLRATLIERLRESIAALVV
jgi:uncharacterized protein VirK/YbjX